jgi:hypothetical protein
MTATPRRVWIAIGLLVIAANLPYLVGSLNAPEGGAFIGNALAHTRVDYTSHLAKMQLGLRGQWLDQLLFTPEEHPAHLLKTFYTALGQVARVSWLSVVAIYHLARLAGMVLMGWAIWQFVGHYLAEDRARWWAFLLGTIVGGLGWVLYLIMPAQTADLAPLEFWLLDAYTFLAALSFPHFPAAIAALLGYGLVLERWLARPSWRVAGWLTLLSLLVGLLQPFDLLLTALLTLALALVSFARRRVAFGQLLMLGPAAAAHVAIVAYDWVAFNSHAIWQAFAAQNVTLSPPPVYVLFAYAWLLIPAAIGLASLWKTRDARFLLPVVWVALVAILLYAPLPTQRRFLMGVQVPLAVIAVVGLEHVRQAWQARGWRVGRWQLLLTTGLLLATISHALVVASASLTANPQNRPELFLDADTLAAQAWLRRQPQDTVVLSTFARGGEIPAFTGRRVVIGHWIETMDFAEREALVGRFFAQDGMTEAERLMVVGTYAVDYVWVDANAPGGWMPTDGGLFAPAFESETVVLYEVRP